MGGSVPRGMPGCCLHRSDHDRRSASKDALEIGEHLPRAHVVGHELDGSAGEGKRVRRALEQDVGTRELEVTEPEAGTEPAEERKQG